LLHTQAISQSKEFIAGVFFNTNGIHIEGDNAIFWQADKGKIWGGGGLSAGLSVNRHLNKLLYMGFELRYIQKGSIYEFINDFGSQSFEVFRLQYIELPALIGYKFHVNKKLYMFETGFAYAKMFSSKLKISDLTKRNVNNYIDDFKNYDISWIASFKLPVYQKGRQKLLLGLRCSYSLLSMHEYYKLYNLVYGIQIAYLINK